MKKITKLMELLNTYQKEIVIIVSLIIFITMLSVGDGKIVKDIEEMDRIFVFIIYGLSLVVIIKMTKMVISYVLQPVIKLRHAFDSIILFLLVEVMIYSVKFDVVKIIFFVSVIVVLTILRILSAYFSPTALGMPGRRKEDEIGEKEDFKLRK